MLAVGFQPDIAQDDHLVIALDLLEGAFEELHRVFPIAGEPFFKGARHTGRRVQQAFAFGVVTGPTKQGAYGLLGIGAVGGGHLPGIIF